MRDHKSYISTFDTYKNLVMTGDATGAIKVWKTNGAKPIASLTSHTGAINRIRFNEIYTLTASADSSVKVWDSSTHNLVSTCHHNVRLS